MSVHRRVFAALLTTSLINHPTSAEALCCKLKNPIKTVTDVIKDTGKAVGEAAGDVVHTAEKAAQDTGKTIEKAAQDTGKTIEKAAQDTGKTIEKAAHDTGKTIEKAGQDTASESERAVRNVGEFGEAMGRYVNRVATDTKGNLSDAEKRVREGKVADAFWHLAVDPIKDSEERAAKLARESSLANAVGQVAASAYGGPGGAAAYAAWYTYRTTGDAELAIRVGIISGATSAAMSAINVQPTLAEASAAAEAGKAPVLSMSVSETAKKAALAGAVGGMAVAAAGGDEAAIRDGFLKGGGMVLIQDGFKAFTGQQGMYAEGAERPALCTSSLPVNGMPGSACAPKAEWFTKDANGKFVLDMSKVPPDRSFVGLATDIAKPDWPTNLVAETGGVMNAFAKVPGMNAMSIFHDQWVISWDMTGPAVQATILPAVVLTYMGTEAPIQGAIQKAAEPGMESTSTSALPAADQTQAGGAPRTAPSFVAYKGNQSRSFFVAQGDGAAELACIVVYQRDSAPRSEDLAPWYAINDKSFCNVKAVDLADIHLKAGWTVLVR